jgi:haloalkane dehalogenase
VTPQDTAPGGFCWGSSAQPHGRVAYRWRDGRDDVPLLVVFHQSPLSGWTWEPIFDHLTYPGAVVVLDTPGYGESSRPPQTRSLEDFANPLWDAVEELRGDRDVVLMGQHTGSRIALTLAVAHPEVVRRVVFQGLSLYTEEERRERAASWAEDIPLQADGGHLAGYWARVDRLYPTASMEVRNRSIRDYLAAAPDYAMAYQAVFAQDIDTVADQFAALGIPSHIVIGDQDLLYPTQDRVVNRLGSQLVSLSGLTDFAVWEDPARFCAELDQILALELRPAEPPTA